MVLSLSVCAMFVFCMGLPFRLSCLLFFCIVFSIFQPDIFLSFDIFIFICLCSVCILCGASLPPVLPACLTRTLALLRAVTPEKHQKLIFQHTTKMCYKHQKSVFESQDIKGYGLTRTLALLRAVTPEKHQKLIFQHTTKLC